MSERDVKRVVDSVKRKIRESKPKSVVFLKDLVWNKLPLYRPLNEDKLLMLDCKRCLYLWPCERKLAARGVLPEECPKCKSAYWQVAKGGSRK